MADLESIKKGVSAISERRFLETTPLSSDHTFFFYENYTVKLIYRHSLIAMELRVLVSLSVT